jgi:hypothetical protein
MAFAIPSTEPKRLIAGDRAQWKRTDLADFPAGTWTLTYYLRGNFAGGQIEIVASADGLDFEVDEAPDTTAAYTPGAYYWSAYVSQAGDRKYVGGGRIEIAPNPVDVISPTDGRSHYRRTLDSIEAVIEKRATTDQQRYVFQAVGRSVDRMPIADLLKFRDYYAGLVQAEEQQTAIDAGKVSGKNILVRFNL